MCGYCNANILDALAINKRDEAVIINQDIDTGKFFIDGLEIKIPINYCPMCRKEAGRVMEAINNLQAFKNDVIEFINKYNIKSIYIDIEEIEAKVCKAGEESNSYKDVTINIEY